MVCLVMFRPHRDLKLVKEDLVDSAAAQAEGDGRRKHVVTLSGFDSQYCILEI